MTNNIITNHTLEQYNRKYRNRRYRLLKITKKEVEDFDKKNPTKTKGYLLSGRKWCLIGDTYYEIPKAPRFTWFRNLNAGVQIATCLLGAGVVATSITVPLVLLNQNKGDTDDNIPNIEISESTKSDIEIKDKKYVGDNLEMKLTIKDEKKEFTGNIKVTIGNTVLKEKDEFNFIKDTGKLSIKKSVIEINKGVSVVIEPELKDKQPGPTPEKKYTISLSANPTEGGSVSGAGEYVKGASVTVTATPTTGYSFDGWYEGSSKVSLEASYTFTANSNRTLTAEFTQDKYTVSISSNPSAGGSSSVSKGSDITYGEVITLNATANNGYTFLGFYDGDTELSKTSPYTYTVTASKSLTAKFSPNITGTVTISGDAIVGQTLTATYTGTETITYQWYRGNNEISGATSSTYTLVEDDLGYAIKVKAIGTGTYSGSVESAATEVVTTTYQIDWVTTKFDGTNTLYDLAKTATSIEFLKDNSTEGTQCGETTNDKIYYSFENKALKVWAKNKISLTDNDRPESTVGIFQNCCDVGLFNFSNIDTSNLTSLNNMFCNCIKITSLDLSTFNTEKVTNIGGLVGMCSELISIDLSSFDTSNVTNMQSVFSTCQKLEKIFVSKKFVVSSVTKTLMSRNMFSDCTSLVGGAGTKFDESKIDKTYARIDQGPDSSAPGYFTDIEQKPYDIDWATKKVDGTNTLYDLATTATSIEFLKSDSTEGTLCGETDNDKVYYSLKDGALKIWANKKIAFEDDDCPSSGGIFKNCSEVTSFNFTNIDTSKVTNFASFFNLCKKIESLDLSNFDTSNATTMKKMFSNCVKLSSLKVDNFNTSNVTNMSDMFNMCKELTRLDLSSFNTSNVADMGYMFDTCENLNTIYVSNNFVTTSVTNSANMFKSCAKLTGGAGSTLTSIQILDSEHYLDATYARVDKGNTKDAAGYFSEVAELEYETTIYGNRYTSKLINKENLKQGVYMYKLTLIDSLTGVDEFVFEPSESAPPITLDASKCKVFVNGVELENVTVSYNVQLHFPAQSKVGDVITFLIGVSADASSDAYAQVLKK